MGSEPFQLTEAPFHLWGRAKSISGQVGTPLSVTPTRTLETPPRGQPVEGPKHSKFTQIHD